jgi:hypothetical protein
MSNSQDNKEKEDNTNNSDEKHNPKKELEEMVSLYLASNPLLKIDNKTNCNKISIFISLSLKILE